MRHDPEQNAAAYLAGSLSKRRRGRFEEHMLVCEDCWREVRLGRAGRALAESGRMLPPQRLREDVRASVEAVALDPRSARAPGVLVVALLLVAATAFGARALWFSGGQPVVIETAVRDFRSTDPAGVEVASELPARLGDLVLVTAERRSLHDLEVVAHVYRDAAGHTVVVYQGEETFPVAGGADHAPDGATWTARVGNAVLFCADKPVPSLIVGDDLPEVSLAVAELGLR